jgi:hypothetical protein
MLLFSSAQAQPVHMAAELHQELVSKILDDAKYPVTIIDHRYDFEGILREATDDSLAPWTQSDLDKLVAWAKNEGKDDDAAADLLSNLSAIRQEAETTLQQIEKARPDDPDPMRSREAELRDAAAGRFKFIKVHLAWIRVELASKPSIELSVPQTRISDANTRVGATGEVWVKLLGKWRRIASLTVRGVKVAVGGGLNWSVDGIDAVFHIELTRLRLDYPILRELPIERLVSGDLRKDKHVVLEGEVLKATIPYVDNNYVLDKLSLPNGKVLRLELLFKKKN